MNKAPAIRASAGFRDFHYVPAVTLTIISYWKIKTMTTMATMATSTTTTTLYFTLTTTSDNSPPLYFS